MPVKPFLVNTTRKTVLAERGSVLRSLWRKAFGAMLFGLPGSYVFTFDRSQTIAITNLFVFEPIDILWLDARMRVVDAKEHFRPFSLHVHNRAPAQYVIELPAGTIAKTRTRRGDSIQCAERL